MNSIGLNHAGSFTTKQLILKPTGGYHDMFRRDYNLNLDNNNLNGLTNVLEETAMDSRINPNILSRVSPDMIGINPHVTSGDYINLPNGWQTTRLTWLLEVTTHVTGNELVSVLQGMTDVYDPSYTGRIDPNSIFYINSINTFVRHRNMSGTYSRPHSNMNVLSNSSLLPNENIDNCLIRPKDVVSSLKVMDLRAGAGGYIPGDDRNYDNNGKYSDKRNNASLNFMGTLINSLKQGAVSSTHSNNYTGDYFVNVMSTLSEVNVNMVPFISVLKQQTMCPSPDQVTFGELMNILPDLVTKTTMIDTGFTSSHNTDGYTNPTSETMAALMLANEVPSSCNSLLLSKISFTYSNDTIDDNIAIIDAGSVVDGLDVIKAANDFKVFFQSVTVPLITQNGAILVRASVTYDMFEQIVIDISINGGPIERKIMPAFADSLYSPLITNFDKSQMFTDSIREIADTVTKINSSVYGSDFTENYI
jgi:hypothetical protein